MKIRCEYKKLVPLKELKPHPKNRNKHGDDQVSRLAQIFEYQGIRHPIIVSNLSGFIVAGHGRLAAATKLKFKEFPVDYQDFDSEESEYAFLVSDNAVALWAELDFSGINADLGDLGPDFDIDLLGIKNFTIDVADKEGLTDDDAIPEKVEPRTKLGDIYKLGNHRLMCGDSTSIDAVDVLMNGVSPSCVFTDPPYGISVKMNNPGTVCKEEIMGDKTTEVAAEVFQVCAIWDVPKIFFGANHYCFDASLPNASCWITWDKQGGKHVDHADCELAWTSLKGPARVFKHIWDGFRRDSEKGEKRVHPTQKPVALLVEILDFFSNQVGKEILDMFGGSGSTLIACEKTNRRCFMMELDPHYADVIVARWEQFTGQKAELMRSGNDDGGENR